LGGDVDGATEDTFQAADDGPVLVAGSLLV
jgi:hypothetical protein